MAEIRVYSSEVWDGIASTLVHAKTVTMANVSLYNWFAKSATYDIANLKEFHGNLLGYIQSGLQSAYLADLTRDFPAMFDWYGKDIVQSEHALELMDAIAAEMGRFESIQPHEFVNEATRYLGDLGLTERMEDLLGCPWPTQVIKLVIAQCLFSRTFIYPNTIICGLDPSYAEYVAMLAHEGGHILTLELVNDPELVHRNRQLAFDMAEALAHAVQICVLDKCGIRYEDLFPGKGVHTCEDYIAKGHPWLQQNARLVYRLVNDLINGRRMPLKDMYRKAFMDLDAA